MPARVTVITATWNKGPRMLRTIESILGQTFGDFEYVVVNDGSTDGTEDLLAGFSDPRLRVIHQANQGLTPTLVETPPCDHSLHRHPGSG
jgi:glycosyltransferase involved in cell wall biosynthesis